MSSPRLLVQVLDDGLPLPRYAHAGDAGLDLYSAEDVSIAPGMRAVVGTGIAVAIPEGHVGLVPPRSGTAVKLGLSLVNTPGVVDSGYRGEIRLALINHDRSTPIEVRRGERVAQLVVVPVATVDIEVADELPGSVRGEGGFGSTGR